MSTTIRPELSKKNRYWIEKHRYYELKHFCMQYPIWKKLRANLSDIKASAIDDVKVSKTNSVGKPVEVYVETREYYTERIEMLERVAKETDEVIGNYILKGVTQGVSYDYLKSKLEIPCCKDTYYDLYRRFFWLLDRERG